MRLKTILLESKRHATTLLFIGGFIFDLIILPDAGHFATLLLGALYLTIVAVAIALREWIISRNTASPSEQRMFSILTFIIAYFSGSALSFISVYAIRSAAFLVSWPLFIFLLVCIIANELTSSHHFRFTLDVGVLLTALFFYVVFNLPIIVKVQNDTTFMISVVIAIIISLVYVFFLGFTSESAKEEHPRLFALGVGIPMFIGMLYFLNIIPAVPLSLAQAGVYHEVVREEDGDFLGVMEQDNRLFSKLRTPVYHIRPTDNGAYFFSSVNAPASLSAPISHTWEFYDPALNRWVEKTTISFTLAGGRESGYRAYSQKENVTEGLWRVSVKVDSKRIVGRVKFYITFDEEETKPRINVTL